MRPMRWKRMAVVLAVLLASTSLAQSPANAQTIVPIPNHFDGLDFSFVNQASGKCLDVPKNAARPGVDLIQYTCHHGESQTFERQQGLIVHSASRLCLDIENESQGRGARLQLWECNRTAAQDFVLTNTGFVVSRQRGLCMDVTGSSPYNHAPVIMWDCHRGANQSWTQSFAA